MLRHKTVERYYGPSLRAKHWRAENLRLAAAGDNLRVVAQETGILKLQYYDLPGAAIGGDVIQTVRLRLEGRSADGKIAIHFNRNPRLPDTSGFRWEIRNGASAVFLRHEAIAAFDAEAQGEDGVFTIALATLADAYSIDCNGRELAAGRMPAPYTDNEGTFAIEVEKAEFVLDAFSEDHIAAPDHVHRWHRTDLLYREAFGAASWSANWVGKGETPLSGSDHFVFRHMGNAFLRRRYDGPLAIDCGFTPMPAPSEFSAGVTDAIFIWMAEGPAGDLAEYLERAPDASLKTLEPMSFYWVDFGGSNNLTTRLRRNPGRQLVRQFTDAPRLLQRDRAYDITLVQNGSSVEFLVDGAPWIRARDPRPLRSGHPGFRAFCADLKLTALEIWRIA